MGFFRNKKMPYKKKYASSKKPSYRRRPYRKGYKRFYKKFNKPKYDGAVAVKCFNVDPVYWESLYSSAYFITGWGQSGTSTNNVRTIDDNQEFMDYSALYKEWRLMGVKQKFTPVREVTSTLGSSIGVIQVASDTDGTFGPTTSNLSLQRAVDFKTYYGGYKRYYKVGKFYAKNSEKWIPTGSYYSACNTKMSVATTGYANLNIVGYMETTYYVMFKGT